ncbi:MAG: hypothetical protein IT341_08615 [Chloroflexi bacterium]|nr:hypothetical protein [Chloroflexota bacterium]
MNGLATDASATAIAALATVAVLGGLLGERRVFGWTQHLFAGLLTGYLVLIAVREVVVPWLVTPLIADPAGRPELWIGLAMVAITALSPWLPRALAAVPVSIMVGSLAAFGLGGALVGTLLPQAAATVVAGGEPFGVTLAAVVSAAITVLVLVGFLHGVPRGRASLVATSAGRWLMVAGIGGWLGYLLYARLVLLIDRIAFLVGDVAGIGR